MDISRLRMGKKWSIWGPLIPYSPKCCEKVCTRYFLKKISISCPEISLKNIVQQINPCWEVGVLLILLILLCCFMYVWRVHLILCWSFELGGYLHLLSMVLSILCPGKVSVGVEHWLKCCSVRLKTAAVAGRAVFEHGEMEAFGNGHKNCHVESTLLNTSKWAVGWDLKWRGLICCHSRAGSYKECPHLWSACLVLFCLVQIQG